MRRLGVTAAVPSVVKGESGLTLSDEVLRLIERAKSSRLAE